MAVGVDADGHFVAFHADHYDDSGAPDRRRQRRHARLPAHQRALPLDRLAWRATQLYTNTCGKAAYRGPWMMETTASSSSTWWRARSEWTRSSCAAAM